ncbi:hypothetical protein C5167_048343 [Papaver somniferum]|uniref:Uncharacterized protein n=1 Tax=Papaver somniferum TaxID=3469 RepID=A0A4Y7KKG6_PAPSO|nr:hypothetical protein C5167_048343 [Papaver somniferum]
MSRTETHQMRRCCGYKEKIEKMGTILSGIPAPSNFGEDWKRRAQGVTYLMGMDSIIRKWHS